MDVKAGGRGCWLLWTGAPAMTAAVLPPFQLRDQAALDSFTHSGF